MANLNPLTNGSYWGPVGEEKVEITLEQSFLSSGYLQALGFGILFIVYIAVMRILWSRRHVSPVTHWALMLHSTSMCLSNLLPTIGLAIDLEETFISNRNFPGGPPAYLGASAVLWFKVLAPIGAFAGSVLADWLLLWRCSVIWSIGVKSGLSMGCALLFPVLLAIAAFATGIAWNAFDTVPGAFLTTRFANLGITYLSLNLALNIILTGMVILRMISYKRQISDCLSPDYTTLYISIASMFIESAAVYTSVSVLLLVALAISKPISQILLAVTPLTQICCSYFIIWRVAEGRALSRENYQVTGPRTCSIPQFRKPSFIILTRDSVAALESQTDSSGDIRDALVENGKTASIALAENTTKGTLEE